MTVTPEEVEEVLDTNESRTIREIAAELSEDDAYCDSCGQEMPSMKQTRHDVRDALRELVDRGEITTTPGFEYRLSRQSDR